MTSRNYTVFSQRVAGYLMMRGFVLVGMDVKTKEKDGKNVFFFKDSADLQSAIKEYYAYNLVKTK